MSFGFGMSAGLRALTAARMGMQTAGNNVANANTAGYSRQRVELSASLPFGIGRGMQIGTGVEVANISRIVDDGLERRLQMQLGMVGAAEVDKFRYDEIESILGEPEGGLSDHLADLFGTVGRLMSDPADPALRGGVVQAGNVLSQGFQMVSRRFAELQGSTFDEVRGLLREVNQRAGAIAELNEQIIAVEASGAVANDLRDTRSQHIKQLGTLLDTNAIERGNGCVDVLVGGHLLVAGNRASTLAAGKDGNGKTEVRVGGANSKATVREGRIAALLQQESGELPGIAGRIDQLARNTILEWNRLHSTGMPRTGPFRSLTSAYGAGDGDGDGTRGDELLSQSGFAFDVQQGDLWVSVTHGATGAMERTKIAIDPRSMTLQDVAAAITGIDHLTASVDPTGKLRITADDGYGFDFSPRLDPAPDGEGTFGGRAPAIGSQAQGPFDLSGQTFPVSFAVTTGTAGAPTVTPVTLDATDFADPSNATAAELAAAINGDLGAAGTAFDVGGRLVIRSAQSGVTAQLGLANTGAGTVLADLGLSTATAVGRDRAVAVAIEGTYTGAGNEQFTFVPAGDGQIGRTEDLKVNVYDHAGQFVTAVDVGAGYQAGEPIELGNGIEVSFGPGSISATQGQAFAMDALADSDTTDLLVAVGMNAFFLGTSAADIEVNEDLLTDPDRLCAGIGTATGDAGNLARLSGLRAVDLEALGRNSLEDFYADVVGDVGFATAAAGDTLDAQDQLLAHLQAERDSVSGVNIDEEMVDMMQFQQSYEAAARFIAVAQQMTDTLINLGR